MYTSGHARHQMIYLSYCFKPQGNNPWWCRGWLLHWVGAHCFLCLSADLCQGQRCPHLCSCIHLGKGKDKLGYLSVFTGMPLQWLHYTTREKENWTTLATSAGNRDTVKICFVFHGNVDVQIKTISCPRFQQYPVTFDNFNNFPLGLIKYFLISDSDYSRSPYTTLQAM